MFLRGKEAKMSKMSKQEEIADEIEQRKLFRRSINMLFQGAALLFLGVFFVLLSSQNNSNFLELSGYFAAISGFCIVTKISISMIRLASVNNRLKSIDKEIATH